jgi:hypothetical protein
MPVCSAPPSAWLTICEGVQPYQLCRSLLAAFVFVREGYPPATSFRRAALFCIINTWVATWSANRRVVALGSLSQSYGMQPLLSTVVFAGPAWQHTRFVWHLPVVFTTLGSPVHICILANLHHMARAHVHVSHMCLGPARVCGTWLQLHGPFQQGKLWASTSGLFAASVHEWSPCLPLASQCALPGC